MDAKKIALFVMIIVIILFSAYYAKDFGTANAAALGAFSTVSPS
jgi:hypothetical protein